MSFTQLFPKYNSSLNPLHGSVIQSSIKNLQQNMVLVDIGLKILIIFFQHELKRMPSNLSRCLGACIQLFQGNFDADVPFNINPEGSALTSGSLGFKGSHAPN